MTAARVAAALGGARRSGHWWRCVCPIHGSRTGRSLTLALRDHVRGLAAHCHAGCNRDEILAELRRRGLIPSRRDGARPGPIYTPRDDPADTTRRIAWAQRIWASARNAVWTPVECYLAGRGIIISLAVLPSLRWVPALRRADGTYGPAMVVRVDSLDGTLTAVHRTWLDHDDRGQWHRRDRASLGLVGGGAVRLGELRPNTPLVIAEGIESAISASELSGWPAWAALSAVGIERLMLPGEARDVVIAVDRDESGVGERSARIAATRWRYEGRRVRLVIPDRVGADANDLLREIRRAA